MSTAYERDSELDLQDASVGSRAVAYLIDIIPITVAVALLAWALWPAFAEAVQLRFERPGDPLVRARFLDVRNTVRDAAMVVYVLGATLAELGYGATPGKRVLGLRTVDAEGAPLTLRRAFVRNLGKIVSLGCCFVGIGWMFVDRDGRTLHDRMGGTRVVRG